MVYLFTDVCGVAFVCVVDVRSMAVGEYVVRISQSRHSFITPLTITIH